MPIQQVGLQTSPHIRYTETVEVIMRHVVYALVPICLFAFFQFGISALAIIVVTTAACVLTEQFFCWMSEKPSTVDDYSAVITGILLALTLPPGFPLWMAVVAGFVAIALGKVLFGGIGYNVFNPALVGRAFAQAAFPSAITTWTPAFANGRFTEFIPSSIALPFTTPAAVDQWSKQVVDSFSGATPLAMHKFDHVTTSTFDLFVGNTAGSAGETSALLILLCGGYLVLRNMLDWRIPVSIFVGTIITSGLFFWINPERFPSPIFMLFAGGMMLGAVFMATDMVGSPVTPIGTWIYGLLIGFFTVIIRLFGGLPEGIMYAILLGNTITPLIEWVTQPKIYGDPRKFKQKDDKKADSPQEGKSS